MPINIKPSNPLNPYYDYTEVMLGDGLGDIKINSKEYCYSNLGYAILGKILSAAGGVNFEEQLNTVLLEFKLGNTEIFNGNEVKNLSDAHNERLECVPHWHSKVFKSSGGIVSTAEDLSKFCHQLLTPKENALCEAIELATSKQFNTDSFGVAFGWHVYDNFQTFSHDGATYGHYAKIRMIPNERKFLICLSNTYNELSAIELTPLK